MWLAMSGLYLIPVVSLAIAVYVLVRAPSSGAPARDVASTPTPALPGEEALRLLDEDERRVLDLVVAKAGDVPQGDIVAVTGFSKAKVSRVIDRLERKRLVVRVRRGMGNHVQLVP